MAYSAMLSETEAFAGQRQVLQRLQAYSPCDRRVKRGHLRLERVLSAYPDAQFIIIHLAPAKIIPSLVSLRYKSSRCIPWTPGLWCICW